MTTHQTWSSLQGCPFLAPAGLRPATSATPPTRQEKGSLPVKREGSSQVLSRGSIRGQIAQGTYTIALCGGGTAEGYASLHVRVCVSLVPGLSSRWVSDRTLHSLLFPSAASRKGFPSTKRSNSQCKAALAATVFSCLHLQPSLRHQSSLLVFSFSLHTPFSPSGFLSHTLTLLKIASCFCSHPSNHSLLEFNTVLSVFTSQRPNTRPGPHNRGAVASASTGGLAHNQQPTVGIPPHTSATSSQAHLLSILASIPADRYDVNPLKSPGTYL